ncbi:MAG: DUF4838 domain-containing protein [Armatimonadetes bacterium]|nr:DUF4838 domain-containing protein [Armatimonadota bacterium]
MNKFLVVASVAFLVVGRERVVFADFLLAEKGRPRAQVVVGDAAPAVVRDAASDFVRIVERMTGAKLDLRIGDPGDTPGPRVLIGDCRGLEQGDNLLHRLTGDEAYAGYVIACSKNALVLRGNTPAGTANAVYGFLQDQLGVRWFLPTEAFEVAPRRATLSAPETSRVVKPSFVCRLASASWSNESLAWARRNRWDTGEGGWAVPFAAGFTHWMYAVFPQSKYGKTHPDIYPLLNGKRAIPENDGEQLAQPCTSNPETVRIAIETINAYLDAHPEAHTYPFSINDNNTWCECDLCKAQDVERPLYRGRRIYSDRWFAFVNAVAKGVRARHPDKFIGCFAYAGVELPPVKIAHLEPNVFVNLTQDTAQYFDPAYKKVDYDLIRAWQQKCDHVGKYDYYGLGALVPRYFPHLLADDLKAIHRMGARAFHSEVYPYWSNMGPLLYIAGRLLWEVNLDPNKLLNEFYASFGPAAKEMRAFYETHEAAWRSQKKGEWFGGIGNAVGQMNMYSSLQVDNAATHLKKAEALATEEVTRARIRFIARGYAYPDLLLRAWTGARAATKARIESASEVKGATSRLERLAKSLEEEEQKWKYSVTDDPVADRWYREGARPTIRGQWRAMVQASLIDGMQKLGAWYLTPEGAKASPSEKEALRRIRGNKQVGLLWQAIQGTLRRGPNLLPNAGFEEAKTEQPGPKGPEWRSSSAAAGWSTWQENNSEGAFFLDEQVKHSGKTCGGFKGGGCLCYITTVPLVTGKSYLAEVWARAPSTRDGTKVTLEVRWNDAQGRWYSGAADNRVECRKSGVWERLMVPFTAPEGAARAVLLLVGYGIEKDDVVRYDDSFVGEVTPED